MDWQLDWTCFHAPVSYSLTIVLIYPFRISVSTWFLYWSFAEKTFVKQSMMLCAFEILLKIGRFEGGGVNHTDDLRGKSYR